MLGCRRQEGAAPRISRVSRISGTSNNLLFIKDLDIEFIDIHQEIFDKEQNPKQLFPFEQFGHYNKAGYKKIAEKLFQITKD